MRTSSFWDITTSWGFNPVPELADEEGVRHRSATNTIDGLAIRRDDTIAMGDAS